jgi:hypothetical protein
VEKEKVWRLRLPRQESQALHECTTTKVKAAEGRASHERGMKKDKKQVRNP